MPSQSPLSAIPVKSFSLPLSVANDTPVSQTLSVKMICASSLNDEDLCESPNGIQNMPQYRCASFPGTFVQNTFAYRNASFDSGIVQNSRVNSNAYSIDISDIQNAKVFQDASYDSNEVQHAPVYGNIIDMDLGIIDEQRARHNIQMTIYNSQLNNHNNNCIGEKVLHDMQNISRIELDDKEKELKRIYIHIDSVTSMGNDVPLDIDVDDIQFMQHEVKLISPTISGHSNSLPNLFAKSLVEEIPSENKNKLAMDENDIEDGDEDEDDLEELFGDGGITPGNEHVTPCGDDFINHEEIGADLVNAQSNKAAEGK